MKRLTIFLMFVYNALAGVSTDSTMKLRFQTLAKKMRLKTLELKEGEYEVRIWNDHALRYGDAHMLYVLDKTNSKLAVSKYIIDSNKLGFKHAVQLNPTKSVTDSLWTKLMQQDILTLPSESAIANQLHPQQQKDSTYTSVEADGSVSVHAKKIAESIWILDGEDYYFEIFAMNNYRNYSYSNPRSYLKHKPNIVELQKVVTILNKLAVLFRSSN